MLPPLPEIAEIRRRLLAVFPGSMTHHNYLTREMAARAVFVFLYVGAVEGTGFWLAPRHIYRMGPTQSKRHEESDRRDYVRAVDNQVHYDTGPDRWFADNTREPIRDETLKDGLVRVGAIVTRPGVPTTSSQGRYALQAAFAAIFDPALRDEPLQAAIEAWQAAYLSAGAQARNLLQKRSSTAAKSKVLVTLPNGESRPMEAGLSSVITKAVVEVFAPRFLREPAVLWISESGNKIIQRDDELANQLGLKIESDKLLPDTILADLGTKDTLLVFIEAVATDGPITEARRAAFIDLVTAAGFKVEQIAFVTAFQDRNAAAFKKAISNLAWGSFAWCLNEPEHLIALDGTASAGIRYLSDFTDKLA